MKYIVLLCDGMADLPLEKLSGKTPMSAANKPNMNKLAASSFVGMVKTVADDLKPGSDVANLSVMGYDPHVYYSGRSPLEAGSIGIEMKSTDISMRCNLVTLSDEGNYSDKTILDYCAGDISTKEGAELINFVQERLGSAIYKFYPGISYRHCLIWDNGTLDIGLLTPPHDIIGQSIEKHLPNHENAVELLSMMEKSYALLSNHPINKRRAERGLAPANSIWLWGEGKRAALTPFKEKFGLQGSVISAVDLIKGIGKFAQMNVVELPGATGYIDTDFEGKAQSALDELASGQDFVYVHVEAPDECGHRNELDNKVKSIEYIDSRLLSPLLKGLEQYEDYKLMILPDHPTPISLRTHTSDPVPFLIYQKSKPLQGSIGFDEQVCTATGTLIEEGHTIMRIFIEG